MTDLRDRLEPFWDSVDSAVIRIGDLAPMLLSRFQTSAFNLKATWYLHSRVESLDRDYGLLVDEERVKILPDGALSGPISAHFTRAGDGTWRYSPFFEIAEFQHLLTAGKASLEVFCRAVGSIFKNQPKAIPKLLGVVRKASAKEPRAADLIPPLEEAAKELRGLIIDPGGDKKSLRDLVTHWERAPVHFVASATGHSVGALVDSRHARLVRFDNYRVTYLAGRVWHGLLTVHEQCLPVIVTILEDRRK